ncbi:MAG: hypothetical protein P4M11_10395 [Candidatus Pacebacteria bacterium]|nr:hypothetical protein [Candidatus Paceibacterota bacterium]
MTMTIMRTTSVCLVLACLFLCAPALRQHKQVADGQELVCGLCHSFYDFFFDLTYRADCIVSPRHRVVIQHFKPFLKWACSLSRGKEFCDMIIDMYTPVTSELAYLLNSTVQCSLRGLCSSPMIIPDSDEAYAKRVLADRPDFPVPRPRNTSAPLKVLVFTDPHIDFDYTEVFIHQRHFRRGRAHRAACRCAAERTARTQTTPTCGLGDMATAAATCPTSRSRAL